MTQIEIVEKFQCPGCVCGGDSKCGRFSKDTTDPSNLSCQGHVAGTRLMGVSRIYLGLPTGFNKFITLLDGQNNNIRIFETFPENRYDHLNVPVWAMEQGGFLFVRCFCPRKSYSFIDIIQGGKLSDVQNVFNGPIDVGKFVDQID